MYRKERFGSNGDKCLPTTFLRMKPVTLAQVRNSGYKVQTNLPFTNWTSVHKQLNIAYNLNMYIVPCTSSLHVYVPVCRRYMPCVRVTPRRSFSPMAQRQNFIEAESEFVLPD